MNSLGNSQSLTVFSGCSLNGVIGPGQAFVLPGDKSISHRAALLAVFAEGTSQVDGFQVSGVTSPMLAALSACGVEWELDGQRLQVGGQGIEGLRQTAERQARAAGGQISLDCGNSATTLRLLAGALALVGVPAVLDGSPGLRRRPMRRIVAPLAAMGVDIHDTECCAPLKLGRASFPYRSLDTILPVASAQVKSCLLLAGMAASGPTRLQEPGPSRDHTERMLNSMGVAVISACQELNGGFVYTTHLTPPEPLRLSPLCMSIPGDPSAAAFLIVAALITPGSHVVLQGVCLNPTRTGLLDALQQMGARIEVTPRGEAGGEPVGDLSIWSGPLNATEISGEQVVRMIDEFPIFAVAAAYANGRTVVRDASELRLKESDRITALCGELRRLGVAAEERPDGFVILGGRPLQGGCVDPHGDHRLAMSLVVAGLHAESPVKVTNPSIISESFPEFTPILAVLGASLSVEGASSG